uniref:ATP-binding cassette transporter subfamily B member 1-like protein X1 n=1 Tax=Brachionus plicatilis TaxID=10195 RepID=A0A7H9SL53_BRAPC|nr:ATP-binding cassette transporter subfamily B member 1-like protein X1 [Brachionus plicatilis]
MNKVFRTKIPISKTQLNKTNLVNCSQEKSILSSENIQTSSANTSSETNTSKQHLFLKRNQTYNLSTKKNKSKDDQKLTTNFNSMTESKLDNSHSKHFLKSKNQMALLQNKKKFFLVQWLIDKKFSVLTENSIVEGSLDLDLELGAVYDFRFGKDVLKAELKMIDNEIECKNQLKILTDYEICPDKKRKLNSEYDLKEITSKNFSEEDAKGVEHYKKRTAELEAFLSKKDEQINELSKKLEKNERKFQAIMNTFDDDKISKYVSLSLNTLRLFGNLKTLENLELFNEEDDQMVGILSPSYPKVVVNSRIKNEITLMLKNPKQSSSSAFRRLIGNLITETNQWSARNGKSMISDFGEEIYAVFDFISSKREDFSWGSCKALIRQICNESRRDEKRNNTFKSIHQHDTSNSEEQSLSSSDTNE